MRTLSAGIRGSSSSSSSSSSSTLKELTVVGLGCSDLGHGAIGESIVAARHCHLKRLETNFSILDNGATAIA